MIEQTGRDEKKYIEEWLKKAKESEETTGEVPFTLGDK